MASEDDCCADPPDRDDANASPAADVPPPPSTNWSKPMKGVAISELVLRENWLRSQRELAEVTVVWEFDYITINPARRHVTRSFSFFFPALYCSGSNTCPLIERYKSKRRILKSGNVIGTLYHVYILRIPRPQTKTT